MINKETFVRRVGGGSVCLGCAGLSKWLLKSNLVAFIFLLPVASCSGKGGAHAERQEIRTATASDLTSGFASGAEADAVNLSGSKQSDTASSATELPLTMFYCTDADYAIFDEYLEYIAPFTSYPISDADLIIETARFFLNKPYVASTLEMEPEGLVVNLREFDCTTFVETVTALSRVVKVHDHPTFDDFCGQLRNIRYRRGFIGNYTDRNHYFSDWIYENETRGHVKDITAEIGGEPYRLNLHFMSSHPESYLPLKSHPEYIEIIREKEADISKRSIYAYIPKAKVASCEAGMRNGDIVCFVTNIEGLDISHVGIICSDKGTVSFIHASTGAKKVISEPLGLSAYVGKSRQNTGLMIVRLQFPE